MDSAEELQSYIHKLSMNLELNRQRNLLQEALDNRAEVGVWWEEIEFWSLLSKKKLLWYWDDHASSTRS